MDNVFLLAIRIVVSDRSRCRLFWISSTDQSSEGIDSVVFFKHCWNARSGAHELQEVFVKRFASMNGVEISSRIVRELNHSHCYDLKAGLFNSAENFSYYLFPNAVRLENR